MKKILKQLFKKIGYEVHKVKPSTHQILQLDYLSNFFSIGKQIGFAPKHIVDIGANKGYWSRKALSFFPDAAYTLIEPQYWLQPDFQDVLDTSSSIRYFPVGVGKVKGSFAFTIHEHDDSCSFRYSSEEAKSKNFKQIELPVETLNGLIAKHDLPVPDIVKIDAEGLDLDVLQGADTLFGKTEVFLVEAAVNNPYFDNTFLKVIQYMDEKGYRLFDITDINKPFQLKILWLAELAFVRKEGVFDTFELKDFTRTGLTAKT